LHRLLSVVDQPQRDGRAVDVDQRGAQGTRRDAGGHALDEARRDESPSPVGRREQGHRHQLEEQRAADHRPSAQMVRDRPGDEERLEERQRVDREHRGREHGGERVGLLIETVQRRRCGGRGEEGAEHRRVEEQRAAARDSHNFQVAVPGH
jgi:hypothetical protein